MAHVLRVASANVRWSKVSHYQAYADGRLTGRDEAVDGVDDRRDEAEADCPLDEHVPELTPTDPTRPDEAEPPPDEHVPELTPTDPTRPDEAADPAPRLPDPPAPRLPDPPAPRLPDPPRRPTAGGSPEPAAAAAQAASSARHQERVAVLAIKSALVERAERGAITWRRQQGLAEMQKLMEEWKKAGHASKADDVRLWQRFSAARDLFYGRLEVEQSQRRAEAEEAARRKEDLIARAEQAATITDTRKAADTMAALMAEWKTVGRAGHASDERLWQRFKTVQDAVYAARTEQRRASATARGDAAAAKRAILAEARGLVGAIDLGQARARMGELTKAFRDAGFAGRGVNEDLNALFGAARDEFYAWAKSEPDRRKRSGQRETYYVRARRMSDVETVEVEIARVEAELAATQPGATAKRQHGSGLTLSLGGNDPYSTLTAELLRLKLRHEQLLRQVADLEAKLAGPAEADGGQTGSS